MGGDSPWGSTSSSSIIRNATWCTCHPAGRGFAGIAAKFLGVVLLDQCPYLIFAETKVYFEVPQLAARAGENPFFKKKPAGSSSKSKKPKTKRRKVNEVAILLNEYGTK